MISIVIPTFQREKVLVNTIGYLLDLEVKAEEILVIDQTPTHQQEVQNQLSAWNKDGSIVWIRLHFPSITRAMNTGLRKASCRRVLFLDDDIIPDDRLVESHINAAHEHQEEIIAGRVLQPWHKGMADSETDEFLFNSLEKREWKSFMAGNVSLPRERTIALGGFDTNFVRVAYHFEAEFSHRWTKCGGRIFYEPQALIHHLKDSGGGTRSFGEHLTTVRPDHAVGKYYYNFCRNSFYEALRRSFKDMGRSVITRHHLKNPGWIPLTLFAEIRGLLWAIGLYKSGKGLIRGKEIELLVIASHPAQYTSPIFKKLSESVKFKSRVLYLTIPDKRSQSLGFNKEFTWDTPLFEGYEFSCAKTTRGGGLKDGYLGVRLARPRNDLEQILGDRKPDAILLTGWHFFGLLQVFLYLVRGNIPILLRMDSTNLKKRNKIRMVFYKWYASFVAIGLNVGERNKEFLKKVGIGEDRIIRCPHVVDNSYFSIKTRIDPNEKRGLRAELGVNISSYCFLYVGKFEKKKRPMDVLRGFRKAYEEKGIDMSLLMVGSGDYEEICRRYAGRYKLPVVFAGFVNQSRITDMYAVSDCLVLASDVDETWGLVVNEAMASRLPVLVSSSVGCAKDLVIHGETGYTFECGNLTDLSRHMVKFSDNPEKSREMGEKSYKHIINNYNIEKVLEGVEQAIAMIHG